MTVEKMTVETKRHHDFRFCNIYRIKRMPTTSMAIQDIETAAKSRSTTGLVIVAPLRKREVSASVT